MTFWEPGPDGGMYEVLPSDFVGSISDIELTASQIGEEMKRRARAEPVGFRPPSREQKRPPAQTSEMSGRSAASPQAQGEAQA